MASPKDAMPWVGLYICGASLLCTLAMAVDAIQGFSKRNLWFPCKFFTINAASITLIAIAMKLPVDLTTGMSDGHIDSMENEGSFLFLLTMLANFLPSLGLMSGKELIMNIIALGLLIITISVNVWIKYFAGVVLLSAFGIISFIFPLIWTFSVALEVPATRRILEHRHKEFCKLDLTHQEINFSSKELVHYVKKYWMMAQTGNPQFVIACSPVSYALGVLCLFTVIYVSVFLVHHMRYTSNFWYGKSDYKWSSYAIYAVQLFGIVVGCIAPLFRSFTVMIYFNTKRPSLNYLNVFRVEKYWTQSLQRWKHIHIRSHIPGRRCKIVFHNFKNMILNICILIQKMVVVICKIVCVVPTSFVVLFSWCSAICKPFFERFRNEPNASDNNARSEIEKYASYILQVEDEAKISKKLLQNMLDSMNRILQESKKKEPRNLINLLEKSTGFKGVVAFDDDQVPLLYLEETHNSWSLVVVTLTAIAVALPNVANDHVKGLLSSIREGLHIVKHIEESLNTNADLVKARKSARWLWTEVEVYNRWLHIELQNKTCNAKTSKEILQWLGDEAVKVVILFKSCKGGNLDHSLHKFIAASSMYKISQTILLECSEQKNWPNDEELFERISTVISDLLCACFTNLPRAIKTKCHHDAMEKRADSIWSAAQLLGKSKKILKILKARQLPNLDPDSMAYIDKWRALLKTEIAYGYDSSEEAQLASSSSNESLIVTVV
ncbi:hypothetical protein HanPI659440_Chr11g0431971 [Helianthus annuus]|nr:hypothetical protein HanPI659440_Chr11g0431971 [Helianthus annuus]